MSNNKQKDLILDAIESAEKSLAVAKRLLGASSGKEIIGTFDGEFMVTSEGKRYQIPPNYASKSMLVVGDTLRLIQEDSQSKFKQIEKIERVKSSGVLTKKDGKWAAVCEVGSFWLLPASVKHYEGEIGDEVTVVLPKEYKKLKASWAALEKIVREEPPKAAAKKPVEKKPEVKKEKPAVKKPPEVVKRVKEVKKEPPKAVDKPAVKKAKPPVKKAEEGKKEVKKEPPKTAKKEIKKPAEKEAKGEIKVSPKEELR